MDTQVVHGLPPLRPALEAAAPAEPAGALRPAYLECILAAAERLLADEAHRGPNRSLPEPPAGRERPAYSGKRP
jgi:hypothetical protein